MSREEYVSEADVLIAGAGPAGLVLACDLARRGVVFRIVEALPAPPDHRSGSRGKGIQPRTLEIYDDLGIIDRVHSAGGPYSPAQAWDGPRPLGAAKFHRIERRNPTPDVPYPSMWMLLQPEALRILRARLADLGGKVEFGTRLVSFTPEADGVTAMLAHPDGRHETLRVRYLAGCDGARGAVRAGSGVEFASETIDPHPMITADVVIEGDSTAITGTCGTTPRAARCGSGRWCTPMRFSFTPSSRTRSPTCPSRRCASSCATGPKSPS